MSIAENREPCSHESCSRFSGQPRTMGCSAASSNLLAWPLCRVIVNGFDEGLQALSRPRQPLT